MISENLGSVVDDMFTSVIATIGVTLFMILCFIGIAVIVLMIIARVKLFRQCGQVGWKAIIPFYTDYVFFKEICGLHWAWVVASIAGELFLTSDKGGALLSRAVYVLGYYNLAIRCGKDKTASAIFGGLSPTITTIVYGFSTLNYDKNIEVKPSGLF